MSTYPRSSKLRQIACALTVIHRPWPGQLCYHCDSPYPRRTMRRLQYSQTGATSDNFSCLASNGKICLRDCEMAVHAMQLTDAVAVDNNRMSGSIHSAIHGKMTTRVTLAARKQSAVKITHKSHSAATFVLQLRVSSQRPGGCPSVTDRR